MNISKNFISTFVATTLLSVTTLSAECIGDHCKVDVNNLSKSQVKQKKFSRVGRTQIASYSQMNRQVATAPVDNQSMNYIDESYTVILDGEEIIRFAHERYVMNDAEKAEYYKNKNLDNQLLEQRIKGIDQKIMEKTTLPQSEYYCDIPKKPVFMNSNGIYECV